MNSPLIKLEMVKKSFGDKAVLRGINLDVQRGDSMVILGGSGAGKSVLMRHIIGLMRPDSGHVFLDGLDWWQMDQRQLYETRKRFGMSFQEAALFDSLSVFENIAFPIKRHRRDWTPAKIANRVHECLDLVGMPSVADLMPNELSGGMRRRVGFARSIALEPEILLFDEPTTGLDPIMTSVLNDVIVNLREQLKITSITITHDMSSAKAISTRLAMLYKGDIVFTAEREAFFNADNGIVRQFVEGRADGPVTEGLLS